MLPEQRWVSSRVELGLQFTDKKPPLLGVVFRGLPHHHSTGLLGSKALCTPLSPPSVQISLCG